ncbi:MAG: hypothetical protein JWR26_2133 [Pedosphaera sp.]|nr:hypothetical protein [Pedosphaera sp.]
MRNIVFVFLSVCALAYLAIVMVSFKETGLSDGSKDIFLADCVSTTSSSPGSVSAHMASDAFNDGMHAVEIDLVQVLKGLKHPGKQIITTTYPMIPGRRYLVYGYDNEVGGADFSTPLQFEAAELQSSFDLDKLNHKPLAEQVALLFSDAMEQANKTILAGARAKTSSMESKRD